MLFSDTGGGLGLGIGVGVSYCFVCWALFTWFYSFVDCLIFVSWASGWVC